MLCQIRTLVLIVLAGFVSLGVQAAQPEASFDLRVPVAPMLRSVDGVNELVYELHLDNFAHIDLKPLRIEVLDAAGDRLLAVYEGQALEQRLDRSGLQWQAETYTAIPSGRRGVVFIELSVADAAPQALRHRIGYSDTRPDAALRWVEGAAIAIVRGQTPVLSPPLRGGPWLAVYDPRWERGHRRAGREAADPGALRRRLGDAGPVRPQGPCGQRPCRARIQPRPGRSRRGGRRDRRRE
jgi:murein DD-endopeptidase